MQAAPITDRDGVEFAPLPEQALSRRVKLMANGQPVQLTGGQIHPTLTPNPNP